MYNGFLLHALFVQGQLFSVKIFDRLCIACQVIRVGAGNDFRGPSRQALPLIPLVSLLCTPFFLALTISKWLGGLNLTLWKFHRGGGSSIPYKKSREVERGF